MLRLASLVLALTLAFVACAEPLPADAPGDVVFSTSCAACHGKNLQGRSGPPLGGPDAPSASEERSYFINTVTKGRSRMPSFESLLTEAQIERVVDFVLSQQDR